MTAFGEVFGNGSFGRNRPWSGRIVDPGESDLRVRSSLHCCHSLAGRSPLASLDHTCPDLVPAFLFTTAACSGLKLAPDYSVDVFVAHYPGRTLRVMLDVGENERQLCTKWFRFASVCYRRFSQ